MRQIVSIFLLPILTCTLSCHANSPDSTWSLQQCIAWALRNNIGIRKGGVSTRMAQVNAEMAREAMYPGLTGGINQNFAWNSHGLTLTNSNLVGVTGTNLSINTGITVFNGFKLRNQVRQSAINAEAAKYDEETTRETVILNVLNAYLQLLWAEEQALSSRRQVELTEQQLILSEERLKSGAIARPAYLQVSSQLAQERQTLASAESTEAMDRIILMQQLELPADTSFRIDHPAIDPGTAGNRGMAADSVSRIAMAIMPQVKSAGLNRQSSELGVRIARASYYPSLSVNAGLGYTLSGDWNGNTQWDNMLSPTVEISINIPIYQNGQTRSNVSLARLNTATAELDEADTRNTLRKSVEQAAQDVFSAGKEYQSGIEGYGSARASYEMADEQFRQGMISPVDFLVQKTNLATAESKLIQAKYKLVFYRKILDYYTGVPLTL